MTVDIGIIGAMQSEVEGLISKLSSVSSERISGMDFYTGELYGKRVAIVRCGIGKVFASMCAEAMILKYSPSLIVNTGVGGAIADGLRATDTVVANRLVQHDMDTSPLGDPVGLVSGINKVYFDTDERASEIILAAAESLGIRVFSGTVATGDRFIASGKDKEYLKDTFGASACEMEGCAIAQAAYVNGTPFAVIRAISDSADGGSPMDYAAFLPIAVKNSSSLTEALVREW